MPFFTQNWVTTCDSPMMTNHSQRK